MPTLRPQHDIIFRPGEAPTGPQPDAVAVASARTPGRAGPSPIRMRPTPPARGAHGPGLPRDRAILLRLVRLRVLSLAELQALVFAGKDRSRLSRRISSLEKAGWLQRWEEPRVRGGRFRLVVPTEAGLTWALRRLEETAAGSQEECLLRTMLRASHMSPLVLPPGRIPSFLPHLREVDRVLVGALLAPPLRVVWASSWPRSFPASGGLRLPAPDGVLVLAPMDGPRQLVLLEHDRATESLRSFVRTKVDRYRLLASRPGALEELTGYRSFRVLVTVGGDATAIAGRLRALRRVVRESFAERLIRVVDAREALEEPSRAFLDEGRGVPAAALVEAMPPQPP